MSHFEKTVHPLVRQHCARCHGVGQSPLFAVEDPAVGYLNMKTKVDLNSPQQSRLVRRLSDDRHNCWSDCQENAQEMREEIERWADLNGGAETEDIGVSLPGVVVPIDLPTREEGEFVTLEFSLQDLGESYTQAKFSLQIQKFGEGAYRVAAPRFVGLSEGVQVKDLRLLINGSFRANESNYRVIDLFDTELTSRQVSDSPMIVLEDQGAGRDEITPTFEILSGTGNPSRLAPTFAQISSEILDRFCLNCHSTAGGSEGGYNFESLESLTRPVLSDEGEVLREPAVTPGYALRSPLFDAVLRGRMPLQGAAPSTDQIQDLRDWIESGAR